MQIGLFDKRGVGISGGGRGLSSLVMIMMMLISMINIMTVMMIVL